MANAAACWTSQAFQSLFWGSTSWLRSSVISNGALMLNPNPVRDRVAPIG
ncbi:hypothetical protein ACQP1W_30290 [Spirillospora sp. CA-255316]